MRLKTLGLALLLTAAGLAGCLQSTPLALRPADTYGESSGLVLHNASVWTADSTRPWASAVAIVGQRIVGVGDSLEEVRDLAGDRPFLVDLAGRMVLPGFHDTHNHLLGVARTYQGTGNPFDPWPPGWDPVEGTIAQQLTASRHIGTWADRNVDRLQDGRLPAPPAELHALGHEPDGHGHDHSHVAPAGRLAANDLHFGDPDHVNDDDRWAELIRLGVATGHKYGVTAHAEAGTGLGTLAFLESLDRVQPLNARLDLYIFPEDLEDAISEGFATEPGGNSTARILGLKIYADGWLGPRTAAMRELYSDRPHQGFAFFTQEEVDHFVLRAHQNGLKLTAHTIGDRATAMLLGAYEKALAAGCDPSSDHIVCHDARFSLEHVQLVGPDLMDRMVQVGLVPSIQLSFATSDAPWAENALGPERIRHAYPWRTMIEEGLTVAGSSDFPIEVLPPLWGVQRIVTRIDLDGAPQGGFMPEQAVDLDTALRLITINAAYLQFREDDLGSVTVGKLADLVVLERNLFDIPPQEIAATEVHLTMVGGVPVHAQTDLAGLLARPSPHVPMR